MDRRRLSDVLRGLSSAIGLAALLVGVPLLLARLIGWPLPHSLPHIGELRHALAGSSISDDVLIKILAVIAWLGWAQVVVCSVVEVAAWAGGRAAHAVPLSGAVQPWVRQLIVTATLLITPLRSGLQPALAIAAAPVSVVVSPISPTESTPARPTIPATTTSAPTAPIGPKTYTVQPRDDLWLLAERHLGNPLRYKELVALNRGVPQPDGRTLQDPDLIRPGWTLRFPDDAAGLPERADPQQQSDAPSTPVAVPAHDDNPSTATCEPAPTPASPSPAVASPVTSQDPVHEPDPPATAQPVPMSDGRHERAPVVPLGILGAGLTATGVVLTLDRLRRVQQRRRPRGRMIRIPEPSLASAEVALRHAADESPANRLDLVLRALAGVLAERRPGPMPVVGAVAVSEAGIEVLLSEAIDGPSGPFVVGAGGRAWTLPAEVSDSELLKRARRSPALLPALVTIGTSEAGTILIDLEAAAVTALGGQSEPAKAAAAGIALEMATTVWADDLSIVLVGTIPPGLSHLERVRTVRNVHEVIDDLAASTAALARALTEAGYPSTLAARASTDALDGWTPTVVVCTDPVQDVDGIHDLLALAERGRGIAVVVVGDAPDVDRQVTFLDNEVSVDPPGLRLTRLGLSTSELAQIDGLIEVAIDTDGEAGSSLLGDNEPDGDDDVAFHAAELESDDPGEDENALEPELSITASSDECVPLLTVAINVIGPVEIVGAEGAIDRRKSVEALAFLALHPSGVNDDILKCALWPDELPSASVFSTTVSLARSRLGLASDGSPHFPHVANGRYRLGPSVTCDAMRLEAAVRAARHEPAKEAITTLSSALELVRGLPFSGTKGGYAWTHTEGITARLEALASEAAHRLAELAIDAGDPTLAQWAALQGLLASPGDEVLYRDRMLAADAAGNPAGVESAMEELCNVVDALEPYDSLHSETVALYERLSHRRRRTG